MRSKSMAKKTLTLGVEMPWMGYRQSEGNHGQAYIRLQPGQYLPGTLPVSTLKNKTILRIDTIDTRLRKIGGMTV